MPLANRSVTLAGQPSKVGGTLARVVGWLSLAGGWLFAGLLFALLFLALETTASLAIAVSAPIALIASLVAYGFLRGGKALQKSGDDAELATKNQAIFALANLRGGVLRAWDVAQSLQVSPKEADDILTKLAKEHPDYVTVDVDDDGNVLYRVIASHWNQVARMAPNAPPPVRVHAPPPPTRVATDAPAAEPLEQELEVADAARQRAR